MCCGLRKVSRFVVLDTKQFKTIRKIVPLRPSYDALSPDASTLYLHPAHVVLTTPATACVPTTSTHGFAPVHR